MSAERRIVGCDVCQGEGHIYRGDGPHPTDYGECPECRGTREMEITVEPIDEEDLES